MGRIAIVTDSNSGITQAEAKEMGITVVPMPFFIDEKVYFEDIDLTQEEFYQKLEEGASVSTSSPPRETCWICGRIFSDSIRRLYTFPCPAALSASCETALGLAQEYGGKYRL